MVHTGPASVTVQTGLGWLDKRDNMGKEEAQVGGLLLACSFKIIYFNAIGG
jgi:hypothetical protein